MTSRRESQSKGTEVIWARQSYPKTSTSPWHTSEFGSARAPAVEEAAGRPRDPCTLAHAQPGCLAIGGKSSRRPDPQPRWHRA
jgi:hypothetical protein